MCGIAGIITRSGISEDVESSFRSMVRTLTHRGPDDEGFWADRSAHLILGQRRLAILDLSQEGHQPMISNSGRYVITYNGEIYNYLEIADDLRRHGHTFRGHSDTEVMLAAFEQWGLEKSLQRMNGMFTIALWDRQERVLHLVRDRLGKKPLYYGWLRSNGSIDAFVLASELKAFRAWPSFSAAIDRDVLALFLKYSYVPSPYSIYQGIYKLPPGCHLTLRGSNLLEQNDFSPFPNHSTSSLCPKYFWNPRQVVEDGLRNPYRGDVHQATQELEQLLLDAVRLRMIADVPLGAFLSGGIDSSTVVALMQAQSSRQVKTFSIGFFESAYDEAGYAKQVALHLGTDHTELYVTPEQAQAVIPRLPTMYDEPFSDSSQIPTFLVSELARKQVTVSLSGDGGDELFAGYNRYAWASRVWGSISLLPGFARSGIATALRTPSVEGWNRFFRVFQSLIPFRLPGDKLHKLADILGVKNEQALYERLVVHWTNSVEITNHARELRVPVTDPASWAQVNDFREHMMFLDLITYLPDDILVKVDRAGMAVSLEGRVPLLDYRVVEFLSRIPLSMKLRDGQTKWLLRQVLHKYVPAKLMERPKMGFGVPIDSWLRGPLKDWAAHLLDESLLRDQGYFNPKPILEKWNEHMRGDRNWHYYLWDVLMFQAWLDETHQNAVMVQEEPYRAVAGV